ncbi:major capsid protein P2 [Kordiimonas aquimaris]|uniref:major capsid protein P2 n=1 Tax=Kordiimonas aquimaris TaxID=707591 RepID=UPI0021CE6EA4|nr:major capsid protein P2 [Kordiimonas aquimaris]
MRFVVPNNTEFYNVSAQAGTANMTLPAANHALNQIDLIYTLNGTRATEAEMIADIDEIELKIGGTTQRRFTPAQLFTLEKLRGQTVKAGRLPIRFTQPERRTDIGEDRTIIFLNEIGQVTIDVKLNAQATARKLIARHVSTPLVAADLKQPNQGSIITYKKKNVLIDSDGENEATFIQLQGRAFHTFHAFSADITSLKVYLDQLLIWDFVDKQHLDDLLEDNAYVPQADVWSFGGELLSSRYVDAMVSGDSVLRWEFEMDAANSFDVLIEELGSPKR